MYNTLAKISLIISILFSILLVVAYIIFVRLLNKWEDKRIEEVEPQLTVILRVIVIIVVISSLFGIIGIMLKD